MQKPLKVFVRTYGCQMNERDSEHVLAAFKEDGFEITVDEYQADIVLVNTCSVRENAEMKAIGKLGYITARKRGKKFPIAGVFGCMSQNLGKNLFKRVKNLDFVAGTWQTSNVLEITKRCIETGERILDISEHPETHNHINKHLRDNANPVKYVSIMQGCSMNCSYCIVPHTRGKERSRPIEDVVFEVENLVERGVKEVCLLGQVVNAYGRGMPIGKDGASPFVQLLRKLNDIENLKRIRFISPHPSFFRKDLIDSYGSLEKLCEYVHLPMQSGSDRILRLMRRPYFADKFIEICESLKSRVPSMSISTDIIVGYPSETEEDFQKTIDCFKHCNFDMAYVFKYSPRKLTLSYEEPDDVSEEEKENRNQRLLSILHDQSLAFNESFINTTQEVLVEEPAKRGNGMYLGRTRAHRKTFFKATDSDLGKFLNVKIQSASVSSLTGTIV